jgi:Domain of unknown function (DUF1905)/Bacteriocin-protection, YdeI or OmpD-Associated
MPKPLVNKQYLLEKFPGKGGWTFARIPEVLQHKSNPFGWVKVKGSIDGVELTGYHLMPMGNGQLFLPVKAAIRKAIGKKEGDRVQVILYADNDALVIPDEMQLCIGDEPAAARFFRSLSDGEKKYYTQWIYSAKKESTRIERLAQTVNRLARHLKFHDKLPA